MSSSWHSAGRPQQFRTGNNMNENTFFGIMQVNNQPPKDMLDQACSAIANEVVDICTAFIQKTAVERAVPEMDKRLASVSSYFSFTEGWCLRVCVGGCVRVCMRALFRMYLFSFVRLFMCVLWSVCLQVWAHSCSHANLYACCLLPCTCQVIFIYSYVCCYCYWTWHTSETLYTGIWTSQVGSCWKPALLWPSVPDLPGRKDARADSTEGQL